MKTTHLTKPQQDNRALTLQYLPRFLFAMLAGASFPAYGNVSLHPLFTDHCVLQRDLPVPVWGSASPGESVAVSFGDQSASAKADAQGKWAVRLTPMKASAASADLVAKGLNTVTVHDVLVGDVWLASGQSNMGTPLSSASAVKALLDANDPMLRFFCVKNAVAAEPLDKPAGAWALTTSSAAKNFSAIAYFFARDIRRTQNVPVGILQGAWGGTPIQTWMSLESIKKAAPIAKTLAEYEQAYARHQELKGKPEVEAEYLRDLDDWDKNVGAAFRAAFSAYKEEAAAARAAGQPVKPGPRPERPEPEQPDPFAMPAPSKRPHTPTAAYNGVIAPLAPYGIRGVLWYQGEENGSTGLEYRVWFPRLIEGWRDAWKQGDVPFLYVQLPGCYDDKKPVSESGWAFTREAQLMTLSVPNTAMVVTSDIGDPVNVHLDNKEFVGQRLALAARQAVYGEKIVGLGPIMTGAKFENGAARISFKQTGGGLVIGEAPWRAKGVEPLPKDRLVGFYIAGVDQKWHEAEARIEGEGVLVSSPEVSEPAAVRYAWAAFPRGNLYNREGLPASPFRTDEWAK